MKKKPAPKMKPRHYAYKFKDTIEEYSYGLEWVKYNTRFLAIQEVNEAIIYGNAEARTYRQRRREKAECLRRVVQNKESWKRVIN